MTSGRVSLELRRWTPTDLVRANNPECDHLGGANVLEMDLEFCEMSDEIVNAGRGGLVFDQNAVLIAAAIIMAGSFHLRNDQPMYWETYESAVLGAIGLSEEIAKIAG